MYVHTTATFKFTSLFLNDNHSGDNIITNANTQVGNHQTKTGAWCEGFAYVIARGISPVDQKPA